MVILLWSWVQVFQKIPLNGMHPSGGHAGVVVFQPWGYAASPDSSAASPRNMLIDAPTVLQGVL